MAQRTTAPDLPGFTHIEWLGGGGFADVFRYQDALGRRVAVKVLHRSADTGGPAFEAEANLMAKLSNHPSIVSIFQAGMADDGRPFLVMEECSRDHLGAKASRRLLTPSKAMEIIIQVAGAVETAHRMGVLHRDIKPANILFTEFQRPALTDFGISASDEHATASNALSPLWAPPEQYVDHGQPMGPWSDVFSLAATMWATLVGHSPLADPGGANDRLSLRHRARTFTPPPTGRHDVPDMLERVLATALARDPHQRYQSALEFARAIQGVQGQMNESVTPIDVLSDDVDDFEDEDPDLLDTGTRVSGFILIDPDQMDDSGLTVTNSGPTGGVTTPNEESLRGQDHTPSGQSVISAPVAQHGRGFAAPGIRDFTGPAIPEYEGRASESGGSKRSAAGSERPQATGRRRWTGVLVTASVLLVGILVTAVLFLTGLLDGSSATAPLITEEPTAVAQDPLLMRVPAVEDVEVQLTGETVTFTWTNPDPQTGDKYLVEEISLPEAVPPLPVATESATVPAQPGQTCVEIRLNRRNGYVSDPIRKCIDS